MAGLAMGRQWRLGVMFAMTGSFFVVEIVVGYLTNSMSLVADSFHMLSDVLALVIAFACIRIAKQKQSAKNTFGWVRAEVLGALVNAVFLLALCFSIFVEAVKRLLEPEPIESPLKILVVGTIGLLVNLVGIFMFHSHAGMGGHGHSHGGGGGGGNGGNGDEAELRARLGSSCVAEAHNVAALENLDGRPAAYADDAAGGLLATDAADATRAVAAGNSSHLNMRGVFLHVLGDALGSVIVIVNALINWRVDNYALRHYLDPSLSLVMVTIIASTTIPLLKETALILLQTPPKSVRIDELKEKLLQFQGVKAVHDFHVWRLAGQKVIATLHIRFRSLPDYIEAAEKIKSFFHNAEIHSTTIQPEFEEMSAMMLGSKECILACPPEMCDQKAQCCAPPDRSPPPV